jgi:hypothetical protein
MLMLDIIIGLFVGWIIVSLSESFYHRFSGHASRKTRSIAPHLGFLGKIILDRWYSHYIIHHCMTFKTSHILQFSSVEEKKACSEKLRKKNKDHIVEQNFGLRVGSPMEHIFYILPTLPYIIIACYFGGALFSIGAILPLTIMPLMSEFIHPLLHLAHNDAMESTHPIIKPFVKTKYFKYIVRYHWLHHKYPQYNFNLMLGGDWLMGVYKKASFEDLKEMKSIGII